MLFTCGSDQITTTYTEERIETQKRGRGLQTNTHTGARKQGVAYTHTHTRKRPNPELGEMAAQVKKLFKNCCVHAFWAAEKNCIADQSALGSLSRTACYLV